MSGSHPGSSLLSLGQASALLGISPSTLRNWADQGHVRFVRTRGGHRRFFQQDIANLRATMAQPANLLQVKENLRRELVDVVTNAILGLTANKGAHPELWQQYSAALADCLCSVLCDEREEHRQDLEKLALQIGRALQMTDVRLADVLDMFWQSRNACASLLQALEGQTATEMVGERARLRDAFELIFVHVVEAYRSPRGDDDPLHPTTNTTCT